MATTLSDPLIGRLVDGRYEVASRIARGGMATVYLALDRRLDREVALKVMHPHLAEGADVAARFRREARAAARLAHPGVVGVYDQGSEGETSYLTMEYVEGSNLRTVLRRKGALTLGEALDVAEPVLDALAAAHRAGLVHRDVKPENVLVATDGRVKVADFGLARAVTEATAATTGTLLGTVAYLAPEIITSGAADARSDVYAVGILLYEMLTGHQPFDGETPIQVAYKHVHDAIPPASDDVAWLPLEIDELIASLTAREPAERPEDAGAALTALRRVRGVLDDGALGVRADVAGDEVAAIVGQADAGDQDARTEQVRANGTIALPIGAVTPEEPPAPAARRRTVRRRVLGVLLVLLTLGLLGGGAWWYFLVGPGAYQQVPDVVGATEADALSALTAEGLDPRTEATFHDTVPEGSVISTDPGPGQDVRRGGEVTVLVSRGIEMLTVPDVAGQAEADAIAALEAAGFTVAERVERPHSQDVEEGTVIGTAPAATETVPHTTAVTLTVSAGREPFVVPNVVGADEATAVADLEHAGAVAQLGAPAHSDTVAAGLVISQSVEAGTQALRGDLVEIVVSLGPELFEVPNVFGQQFAQAEETLTGLGFVVTRENVLGGIFGTVHSQSVEPGAMRPAGTEIILTVV